MNQDRNTAFNTMGRSKATNKRVGNNGGNGSTPARLQVNLTLAHRNQKDAQQAIDYHWSTLPNGAKKFLAEADHDANFQSLIAFWKAQHLTLDAGTITSTMCGSSLYLSLEYLRLGKRRAARNLLLNGGFLQEAYYTPMSVIVAGASSAAFPRFRAALDAASSVGAMQEFLRKAMPLDYQRMMNFASQTAHGPCSEYVKLISHDWKEGNGGRSSRSRTGSRNGIGNGTMEKDSTYAQKVVCIVLLDGSTNESCKVDIGRTSTLKSLFDNYAQVRGTSLRSLRFSHGGRTLFLSSVKNKTPEQLGLNDFDTIVVTDLTRASEQEEREGTAPSTACSSNNDKLKDVCPRINRAKNGKKKKKKAPMAPPPSIEMSHEELKIKHSNLLTKLHEEAEHRFKRIRQRLNNLSIERSSPKIKSRRPKFVPPLPQTVMNNPPEIGLGGKAGKSHYIVQIGEVQNLYKTGKRASAPRQAVLVDLHGLTETEALHLLDESLPRWNDAAMSGSYPFVIPVDVVCGCGNQVLSEAVEGWIRRNDKVSNAPKNLWVPTRNCPYPYAA